MEITWIIARSYFDRTCTFVATLKSCHASNCINIDTVTLTCNVALPFPVPLNVCFTTLTCAENVTVLNCLAVIIPDENFGINVTLVARSPRFPLNSLMSENPQTLNISTLCKKIASSCCVGTCKTTDTVTLTCNVVLLVLVLLIDCLTMLTCAENILVVNLSRCYHP